MENTSIIGLLTVTAMVAIPTAGGLVAYGYLKRDVQAATNLIHGLSKQVLAMDKEREKTDREVWPAIKNGGIVTQEQFERRIALVEKGIQTNFDGLTRRIDQLDRANQSDHDITDAAIERIVGKVLKNLNKGD